MLTTSKILRALGFMWTVAASILILVGYIGVWMHQGFPAVVNLLSPFNLSNWLVTMLMVAPGFGLVAGAERLEVRASRR